MASLRRPLTPLSCRQALPLQQRLPPLAPPLPTSGTPLHTVQLRIRVIAVQPVSNVEFDTCSGDGSKQLLSTSTRQHDLISREAKIMICLYLACKWHVTWITLCSPTNTSAAVDKAFSNGTNALPSLCTCSEIALYASS